MIKPIGKGLGYVFKQGNIKQIQWKNKNVTIFENDEYVKKIYCDTVTGKIIKKVIERFKEV